MDSIIGALMRLVLACTMMAETTLKEPIISLLHDRGEGSVKASFFIFGDSLLDAGNNDYLNLSFKVNHWPYGETFFHNATGRFSDGRIPPDFIAKKANLSFIKPYLEPNFSDYTEGANFASGGAGILPGTVLGSLYLELQVNFFEEVTERLKQEKGDVDALELISRAVYHIGMGGDDYIIREKDSSEANTTISPQYKEVFVGWRLYRLGGRRFSFQNVAPIGCMPSSKASIATGECWDDANILAEMHNEELSRLLSSLAKDLPGFKYTLFDYYTTLLDRMVNYTELGFKVGEIACCGSGEYNGKLTCGVNGHHFTLCRDPTEFVFFDCAHPTEEANRQLSSLMWSGKPPVVGPHNLQSLFEEI